MDREKMEGEGWQLASTSSGADVKRIVEMYQELGFDVYTEEITPEQCGDCTICFVAGDETLTRIYTRPKVEKKVEEELFD